MRIYLITVIAVLVAATVFQIRAVNANEPPPTLFSGAELVSTEFRLLDHGKGGLVPAFGGHPIACRIDFSGVVDNCVKHLRSMKPGMKVEARVVLHQMTFEQVWVVVSARLEDGSHFENDEEAFENAYLVASRNSVIRHDIVLLFAAVFAFSLYRFTGRSARKQ